MFPTHIIVNLSTPPKYTWRWSQSCTPDALLLESTKGSIPCLSPSSSPHSSHSQPSGQLPFGFLLLNVRGQTLARNRNYTIIPRQFCYNTFKSRFKTRKHISLRSYLRYRLLVMPTRLGLDSKGSQPLQIHFCFTLASPQFAEQKPRISIPTCYKACGSS